MKGTIAFQGWNIVGLSTLTIGAMVAVIWLFYGIDEQAMRMAIRATACTSSILFLGAFVASALGANLVKFFHGMAFKESPLFRDIDGSVA